MRPGFLFSEPDPGQAEFPSPMAPLTRKPRRETALLGFYGDKSPQWLSDLAHMEDPWQSARRNVPEGLRGDSRQDGAVAAGFRQKHRRPAGHSEEPGARPPAPEGAGARSSCANREEAGDCSGRACTVNRSLARARRGRSLHARSRTDLLSPCAARSDLRHWLRTIAAVRSIRETGAPGLVLRRAIDLASSNESPGRSSIKLHGACPRLLGVATPAHVAALPRSPPRPPPPPHSP